MFTRKLNLDDIKPLVDELKQYLNFEISDRINSNTLHHNKNFNGFKGKDKRFRKREAWS